mgnify:CR=1 FL=1
MKILLISSSLNPKSKSRLLAEYAQKCFAHHPQVELDFLDLAQIELPMCDGGAAYGHPNTLALAKRVQAADGFLVSTPIYNYSSNGAIKNFIDLTGNDWKDKFVGFMAAAGGGLSYMSVMEIANSLMLNSRTVVLPRYVYTDGSAFVNGEIKNEDVIDRIEGLVEDFVIFGKRMLIPKEQL